MIMTKSEAVELLIAAKPLIDRFKGSIIDATPNQNEREALEEIEQVLKSFSYRSELLKEAGWSSVDVAFLLGRLRYYRHMG